MGARGRKSTAERLTSVTPTERVFAPPPKRLDENAAELWESIIASRPVGFYGPGDLPLLREYCYNLETLLPRLTKLIEEEYDPSVMSVRDKLVRQTASLAVKLRICVSSRTRPDVASMKNSLQVGPKLWE